jgi:hypothetical protein
MLVGVYDGVVTWHRRLPACSCGALRFWSPSWARGVLLGLRELFNAVTGNRVTRPGVMTQVQPPGTLRFDMDQQAEA